MKEKSKQMIDGTRCNGCGVYLGEQQYESPRFCVICSKKGKPAKDLKAENERLRSVMGRMKELLEDIANGNRISSPPISAQEEVAKKLLVELAEVDREERETVFHETKVVNGVLCHRGTPDGEWEEYSMVWLTASFEATNSILRAQFSRNKDLKAENERLRAALKRLENNPDSFKPAATQRFTEVESLKIRICAMESFANKALKG